MLKTALMVLLFLSFLGIIGSIGTLIYKAIRSQAKKPSVISLIASVVAFLLITIIAISTIPKEDLVVEQKQKVQEVVAVTTEEPKTPSTDKVEVIPIVEETKVEEITSPEIIVETAETEPTSNISLEYQILADEKLSMNRISITALVPPQTTKGELEEISSVILNEIQQNNSNVNGVYINFKDYDSSYIPYTLGTAEYGYNGDAGYNKNNKDRSKFMLNTKKLKEKNWSERPSDDMFAIYADFQKVLKDYRKQNDTRPIETLFGEYITNKGLNMSVDELSKLYDSVSMW